MKTSGNPFDNYKKVIFIAGMLTILTVGLQFASPEIKNPPITGEIALPANVKAILKRACFDCHSNDSEPEWFDKIAPVSVYGGSCYKRGQTPFHSRSGIKIPPQCSSCCAGEYQGNTGITRYTGNKVISDIQ